MGYGVQRAWRTAFGSRRTVQDNRVLFAGYSSLDTGSGVRVFRLRPALVRLDGLMLLTSRLIIMMQGKKFDVQTVWARDCKFWIVERNSFHYN
jgi:hypothetical protein